METFVNSIISALSGLFGAVIGAYVSWTVAKKSIRVNFGSQEIQDYNAIKDLEQKVIDCEIDIARENNKEENKTIKELYDEKLNILRTQYSNTYEDLCARYLTGKIDKENFINMYQYDIIDLVKNNLEIYNTTSSCRYNWTMKVYREITKEHNKKNQK